MSDETVINQLPLSPLAIAIEGLMKCRLLKVKETADLDSGCQHHREDRARIEREIDRIDEGVWALLTGTNIEEGARPGDHSEGGARHGQDSYHRCG